MQIKISATIDAILIYAWKKLLDKFHMIKRTDQGLTFLSFKRFKWTQQKKGLKTYIK